MKSESSLKRVGKFFYPYNFKLLLSIFLTFLGTLFSLFSFTLVIPFLGIFFGTQAPVTEMLPMDFSIKTLQHNFYYYLSTIIATQGKSTALGVVSLFIVIAVFLKTTFTYLGNYALAPIRTGVVRDIRNYMYHKILSLQISFFSEERKGDIMSRMTSDVQEIENSVMQAIKDGIQAPIVIIIYLAALLFMSLNLTLFVFILLPLSGAIIGKIGKSLKRKSLKGQQQLGNLLSNIEETLFGLSIIQAFNVEPRFDDKFKQDNDKYSKIIKSIWRKRDLASPLSEYLSTIVIVIILYYGSSKILNGTLSLSPQEFIGYLIIFSQIISPAKKFSNAYYSIQRGLASFERVKDILDAEITITEKPDAQHLPTFQDEIIYDHVSFSYQPKKTILDNIQLSIKKGKTIALVGQSGSGKTTMANLLPRFYDVNAGAIILDGVNIKDIKIADIRNLMGVVTQESILFNDTIFNNIAFIDKEVSEEEVIRAAKIANAHDFILETENGYQTVIGDRGSKLSGGQRQRLSIARAILKNPPILILDEATSALDTESEYLVQDAIEKLMNNRTSVVIAHRLSTIKNADEIIVMDKGKIIERGTHKDLLNQNGAYTKLYKMQTFD